jgi:hypothetical protein
MTTDSKHSDAADAAFARLEEQVRDVNSALYKKDSTGLAKFITAVGEYDGDVRPTLTAIKGEDARAAQARLAVERRARAMGIKVHTLSDTVFRSSSGTSVDFRMLPTTAQTQTRRQEAPGHSMLTTGSTTAATAAGVSAPDVRRQQLALAAERRIKKSSIAASEIVVK